MKKNLILKIIIILLIIILAIVLIFIFIKSRQLNLINTGEILNSDTNINVFKNTKWELIKVEFLEDEKLYEDTEFNNISLDFKDSEVVICINIEDNQCFSTTYENKNNTCNIKKVGIVDIYGSGIIYGEELKFPMDRGIAKIIYSFKKEE